MFPGQEPFQKVRRTGMPPGRQWRETKMKSFRVKIIVSVFAVAFLSIAITLFFGMRTIDEGQRLDVRDRLLDDAVLAASLYRVNGNNPQDLYECLARKAKLEDLRVTIVANDGTIRYDSSRDSTDGFDNHLDRPEISEAIRTGTGFSCRDSSSVSCMLVYAAARLDDGGAVRLAIPLDNVRRDIRKQVDILLNVGIGAAVIALLVALLVSRSLSRSFVPMIDTVEGIAAGRYRCRVRHCPGREFEPLARAVNTMAQNIEENVKAYAAQTAQLEIVLNTMSDGVLVLGPRGSIRRCNWALERNFPGIGQGRGKQVVEFIPSPALQNAISDMLSDKDGSERSSQVSLHVGLGSGKIFSVLLSRPDSPDPRIGLVAVFRDMTELMRLEQVRRDFVANVSHELRTPLTAIRGYAETILSVDDREQCRKFTEVILRNATGLSQMVQDLLSLSSLERGEAVDMTVVDARIAIEEAAAVCRQAFDARNLTLDCQVDHDTLVCANESYLSQVFRNLFENAARYADAGSAVHVSVELAAGHYVFRVADKGALIPREDIERIFERFYSVERHHGTGAAGLGLAICRHILERFQGRIWAQSPDADGMTSFVFTLLPAGEGGDCPEAEVVDATTEESKPA